MKILSSQEIRQADAYTIEHEPIRSIDLMERAATRAYNWIADHYNRKNKFLVFCGIGNNGGDGLVIARLLKQSGYHVEVYAVRFSDKCSEDFNINEHRLKEIGLTLHDIKKLSDIPELDATSIIIDSIFGSGLSRPVKGFAAELIRKINTSLAELIAIDIPSGLFSEDNSENDRRYIIHAKHTLTFQAPKLAFLFPENEKQVGNWHVIPIGLDEDFIERISSKYHFVTPEMLRGLLKPRKKFDHKGTYGHALLIAGSKGKMGAAVLCAAASLRSGVGLVSVQIPACGMHIMQVAIPEAMIICDTEENCITKLVDTTSFPAVGVGPGLGQDEKTEKMLKLLIQNSDSPLVIDADALNMIGRNITWLPFLPASSILTPHPKEFERLAGSSTNHFERFKMQVQIAMKYGIYVILKGAMTSIACPDGEVYFNSTGNPGMATAGSGDVLTGIITGLMAQGYDPKQSAVLGVYLHGFTGDIKASEIGEEAMIAGDIVKGLADGFKKLKKLK